jgi:chromosome segregation ATPase
MYQRTNVDPFISSTHLALSNLRNFRSTTEERLSSLETSMEELESWKVIAQTLLSALDATRTETDGSLDRKVDNALASFKRQIDDDPYSLVARVANIEEFNRDTETSTSAVHNKFEQLKRDVNFVKGLKRELDFNRGYTEARISHLTGEVRELRKVRLNLRTGDPT